MCCHNFTLCVLTQHSCNHGHQFTLQQTVTNNYQLLLCVQCSGETAVRDLDILFSPPSPGLAMTEHQPTLFWEEPRTQVSVLLLNSVLVHYTRVKVLT